MACSRVKFTFTFLPLLLLLLLLVVVVEVVVVVVVVVVLVAVVVVVVAVAAGEVLFVLFPITRISPNCCLVSRSSSKNSLFAIPLSVLLILRDFIALMTVDNQQKLLISSLFKFFQPHNTSLLLG